LSGKSKRFFFSCCVPPGKTRVAREGAWNEKGLPVGSRSDREFRFASISRGTRGRPVGWIDTAFFGAKLPLGPEPQLLEWRVSPLFSAANFFDAELSHLCRDPFTIWAHDDHAKPDLHFEPAPVRR
jgi:hypothetical protein